MRVLAALIAFSPVAALAQVADTAAPQSNLQQFAGILPLIAIAAVMYVLLIRPQSKRMKEHQSVLAELKKGDEVITGGGLIGKIIKIDESAPHVTVEIASGVQVQVVKSTITGLTSAAIAKPVVATKKNNAVKNDNVVPSKDQIANDN